MSARVLVLACFGIFAMVMCEWCEHDGDCVLTTCIQDFEKDCYRSGNVCTCKPHDSHTISHYNCSTHQECWSLFDPCHGEAKWHCFDSRCVCAKL